jgi:Uma2 family endonuclease
MNSNTTLSEYELERQKPMPSINHGAIQANLIFELQSRYRSRYRISSEVSLDLQGFASTPDISIFETMPIDTKKDIIAVTKPPLCAIEIISPTQSLTELIIKAGKYFQHGVKSCWLVLPGLDNIYVFSTVNAYQIFRAEDTLVDTALNISFPLGDVFV